MYSDYLPFKLISSFYSPILCIHIEQKNQTNTHKNKQTNKKNLLLYKLLKRQEIKLILITEMIS